MVIGPYIGVGCSTNAVGRDALIPPHMEGIDHTPAAPAGGAALDGVPGKGPQARQIQSSGPTGFHQLHGDQGLAPGLLFPHFLKEMGKIEKDAVG